MDTIRKDITFHQSFDDCVQFGLGDSCAIDQRPVADYNINPDTGNPYSVIDLLLKSDKLEQQRILAELQEYKSSFLPPDMPDVDAVKYMTPRLCQMPSELAEFESFVVSKQLEEEQAKQDAAKKAEDAKRIKDLFDDVSPKKD